jgi:ubiquinone/menaquinone biosynthesis C-methylase UbiE
MKISARRAAVPRQGEVEEVRRIEIAYAERDRTLSGTLKRDQTNPGNQWVKREHRQRLEQILRERFGRRLAECRVLDVGCGYGSLLAWFHELGVPAENLFGVDLLPNRIETARKTYPEFTFIQGNAEHFEFPEESFDLLAVFTVFSSILDPVMARNVAQGMTHLLKRDGAVVWYDMRYRNPWNRHTIAMRKPRIGKLFPSFTIELESMTLLPPLARRFGRTTHWTYPVLASVPLLRGHYLGLLRLDGGTRSPGA